MTVTEAMHVLADFLLSSPAKQAEETIHAIAALVAAYHRARETADETAARHAREDLEWYINNPQWRRKP